MTIYILLIFIALCIGMAISVHAFGTGGKRKHIFRDIYFSVENTDGIGIVYTKTGEYSAILKIENPVQKYSANTDGYYEFTHLFSAIAQTLGEGYAIHKQDANNLKTEAEISMNSCRQLISGISTDDTTRTVYAI